MAEIWSASYYRARYYDSNTGRFLSEDLFEDGASLYQYVSNSVPNLVDTFGLQSASPEGSNPFPTMSGSDLATVNKALEDAKKVTCDKDCDGALQAEGIKSLAALVSQMAANTNVLDGRKSTLPLGKKTVAKVLGEGTAGAIVPLPLKITFLGNYFFNGGAGFFSQQRALILIHEAVHQFGGKLDKDFGGSRQLTNKIAEKCFPALKATHLLGDLTF